MSQRPTYLCIDELVLDQIARENRMDAPSGGAQALIDTVRQNVRTKRPTSYWYEQAVAWKTKGCPGDPPFLTILAISVLSVTRKDFTTGASAYYKTLRHLLGLPENPPGCPEDFDSDTQSMWTMLNDWLGRKLEGSCGLPTASNQHGYANIAWPTSQAIMRSSDRERLPQFFTDLGFEFGEALPAEFPIVAKLLAWVKRGNYVSKRLTRVLSTKGLTDQLGSALRMELHRWDGAERDESGWRTLELLLTWDDCSRDFGAAVKALPGVERGTLSALGVLTELEEAGTFSAVPIHLHDFFAGSRHLASVTTETDQTIDVMLRRRSRDCVVLSFNDDLGQFCEARQAELNADNVVIVVPDRSTEVEAVLGRLGAYERKDRLSRGKSWMFYKYTPKRSEILSADLASLAPGSGRLAEVDGGLLINRRRRTYLVDGPPDVRVEVGQTGSLLAVDGRWWYDEPRGNRYRLAEAEWQVGEHKIVVDGRPLTFSLVDHVQTDANHQPALGYPLRPTRHPAILEPFELVGRGARILEHDQGTPAITGAVVHGVRAGQTPELTDSTATSAGGQHFLVGDPGEAAEVFPEPPAWLGELDVDVAVAAVDVAPCLRQIAFTSKWYVHRGPSGATAVSSTSFDACEGVTPKHVPRVGPEVWNEVLEVVDVVEVAAVDKADWSRWRDAIAIPPRGRRPA